MAAPSVLSRQASVSSTSDANSFTPTLSSVTLGKTLLAIVSADQNPALTTSSAGWRLLGSAANGSIVTGAVFIKLRADGNDALVVDSSSSQQFSAVLFCIDAGDFPGWAIALANGSSTNSDPPNLSITTSRDVLWIATRSGDAQVVATVAPTNFTNLQSRAGGGANGASTNTAERTFTGSSLNPGTFTSASEQWVSATIAIWADTETVWNQSDKSSGVALSSGNRTVSSNQETCGARGSIPRTESKLVWGWTCVGTNYAYIGVCTAAAVIHASLPGASDSLGITYMDAGGTGRWEYGGADHTGVGVTLQDGDFGFFALDRALGKVWININGTWYGNPDAGTGGESVSFPSDPYLYPVAGGDAAWSVFSQTSIFIDGSATGHGLTGFTPWNSFAAGVTLDVPAATIALAGAVPTVAAGKTIAPPAAAVSLTAYAPAVSSGALIAPPAASIAMQAFAPSVSIGAAVPVPVAAIALASFAPAVAGGASIAVPFAQISVAGYAPQTGSGALVAVPHAALAAQGFAPAVAGGASIAVPFAQISVAGYAPQIGSGVVLAVPAAAIGLAGYAPGVAAGASIAPPAASIAMQAFAPSISIGAAVAVPAAQIGMQAYAPAVGGGLSIAVPGAQISVAGFAPAIAGGVSLAIPAAAISLAAHVPSVGGGITIAPPAASVAMQAFAPAVMAGASIAVPFAQISIAGLAPAILTGAVIAPPAANINVAGFAPAVAGGASIAVPFAQISIAALVPAIAAGASVAVPAAQIQILAFKPSLPFIGALIEVPAASIAIIGLAPAFVGFIGEGDARAVKIQGVADPALPGEAIAARFVTVSAVAVSVIEISATLKRKVP